MKISVLNTVAGGSHSGMDNPMTTEGDIIVGGESGSPERLAPSLVGRVLKISADGTPAWETESVCTETGWAGERTTYAELPAAADHDGEVWYVVTETSFSLIPFVLPKAKGLYRSNGTIWEYAGAVEHLLDDTLTIKYDNDDNTKTLRDELSSISTGTQRVATWQDKDVTVAGLDDIPDVSDFVENTREINGYDLSSDITLVASDIPTDNTGVSVQDGLDSKEELSNKENTTLDTSATKYPTNRLVKEYADGKVEDAIVDNVTTKAPSQNAVYDALALKVSTSREINGQALSDDIELTASDIATDNTGETIQESLDGKVNLDQTTPQTIINGRLELEQGIKFSTSPTVGTHSEGKVYWDSTFKTLAVESGVGSTKEKTLQVGQEDWRYVTNNSGATIPQGILVYVTGSASGLATISRAQANMASTSNVIGMTTEDIANGESGMITVRGNVNNLDTEKIGSAILYSQGILYRSRINGTTGNAYKVEVIDSTSGGLSYSEDATTITIDLGGTTPTTAQVVALFTATPSALCFVNKFEDLTVEVHAIEDLSQGVETSEGDLIYLSPYVSGSLTTIQPETPNYDVRIGRLMTKSATVGRIYIRLIPATALDQLVDVSVPTPTLDDILKYNGTEWVNAPAGSATVDVGINFYMDDTAILPIVAGQNVNEVNTLSKTPVTATPTVVDSIVLTGAQTLLGEAYLYNTALSKTVINAGTWNFSTYCRATSNNRGLIQRFVYQVIDNPAGVTFSTTGTGTSRTVTISATTSTFVAGDASATLIVGGYFQTEVGLYKITAVTNAYTATISVPTTYTNETDKTFKLWRNLFGISTGTITNTVVGLYSLVASTSAQLDIPISATDKIGEIVFGTSTNTVTVYWTHNGTATYSNFRTPLVLAHNDLAGLQGGSSTERYHLSLAQSTVVSNTSNTNTGDETTSTIKTKLGAATAIADGYATSTQITKLDGIAAGAEVNVNADWNSSSGDSQILNKPTLLTVANIGSTAETVGGSVDNGTATTAARSDHKHAITNPKLDSLAAPDDNATLDASTTAHGLLLKATAPASGLMNFVGLTNGDAAYANKPLFDTTNPAMNGTAAPGTQVIAARRDHVHASDTTKENTSNKENTTIDTSTTKYPTVNLLKTVQTEDVASVGNGTIDTVSGTTATKTAGTNRVIHINTSVDCEVELPDPATGAKNYYVKLLSDVIVSVVGAAGTVDGVATYYQTGINTSIEYYHDGANWFSRAIFLAPKSVSTVYTASDASESVPAWAKSVTVQLMGAGAGGGSGRRGAAGAIRTGGAGGAAGGVTFGTFPVSYLDSTYAIVIGAKGTGGAAQTSDSSNGNAGTDGGVTTFVSGGFKLTASGGVRGAGGTGSVQGYGAQGGTSRHGITGNQGGLNAQLTPVTPTPSGSESSAGGGGGGGGVNAADNVGNGINGGVGSRGWEDSAAGGAAASNGTDQTASKFLGGGGGGGGGGSKTGNATAGGNGGLYGAGGGGGGASLNATGNSGAGGTGADGIAVVTFNNCFCTPEEVLT